MSSGPRLSLVSDRPNSARRAALSLEPLSAQQGAAAGPVYLAADRGRVVDPRAFQGGFADQWRDFLNAEFRGAVEIAYFFGVTEKGAEKWLRALGGPNGAKVALAFAMRPDAAARYLLPHPVLRPVSRKPAVTQMKRVA
jgi:hypothetical protein